MEVIVRPDPYHSPNKSAKPKEHISKVNVTAENEFIARRCALEQVWYNHYLISKFLNIQVRSTK